MIPRKKLCLTEEEEKTYLSKPKQPHRAKFCKSTCLFGSFYVTPKIQKRCQKSWRFPPFNNTISKILVYQQWLWRCSCGQWTSARCTDWRWARAERLYLMRSLPFPSAHLKSPRHCPLLHIKLSHIIAFPDRHWGCWTDPGSKINANCLYCCLSNLLERMESVEEMSTQLCDAALTSLRVFGSKVVNW